MEGEQRERKGKKRLGKGYDGRELKEREFKGMGKRKTRVRTEMEGRNGKRKGG